MVATATEAVMVVHPAEMLAAAALVVTLVAAGTRVAVLMEETPADPATETGTRATPVTEAETIMALARAPGTTAPTTDRAAVPVMAAEALETAEPAVRATHANGLGPTRL